MAFNEPQNWDADLLPRQVERDTEDMGSTTRGKLLTRLMSACEYGRVRHHGATMTDRQT